MDIGRFNRRVIIQTRDLNAVDSYGQLVEDWQLVAQVWAEFVFLSGVRAGLEAVRGGQLAARPPATWRVRYRTDLSEGMRLVDGLVIYDIKSVLPDHRRKDVTDLLCEVAHG